MASSVLAPVQERGRAALEQLGLPNRRQEPWRLTDLKRLAAVSELPASASPLSTSLAGQPGWGDPSGAQWF